MPYDLFLLASKREGMHEIETQGRETLSVCFSLLIFKNDEQNDVQTHGQ